MSDASSSSTPPALAAPTTILPPAKAKAPADPVRVLATKLGTSLLELSARKALLELLAGPAITDKTKFILFNRDPAALPQKNVKLPPTYAALDMESRILLVLLLSDYAAAINAAAPLYNNGPAPSIAMNWQSAVADFASRSPGLVSAMAAIAGPAPVAADPQQLVSAFITQQCGAAVLSGTQLGLVGSSLAVNFLHAIAGRVVGFAVATGAPSVPYRTFQGLLVVAGMPAGLVAGLAARVTSHTPKGKTTLSSTVPTAVAVAPAAPLPEENDEDPWAE